MHPYANESSAFPPQSATQETAIVALLPGLRPETRIAIFCGLSTVGTQQAVEFLSQPESIRTLTGAGGYRGRIVEALRGRAAHRYQRRCGHGRFVPGDSQALKHQPIFGKVRGQDLGKPALR